MVHAERVVPQFRHLRRGEPGNIARLKSAIFRELDRFPGEVQFIDLSRFLHRHADGIYSLHFSLLLIIVCQPLTVVASVGFAAISGALVGVMYSVVSAMALTAASFRPSGEGSPIKNVALDSLG